MYEYIYYLVNLKFCSTLNRLYYIAIIKDKLEITILYIILFNNYIEIHLHVGIPNKT